MEFERDGCIEKKVIHEPRLLLDLTWPVKLIPLCNELVRPIFN